MSFRIEQYDGGDVLYVALDPDGAWAQSEFPNEQITLDFNAQGGLIGIEMTGLPAREAADALLCSVKANPALKEKLAALVT